jgi:hypothetical protein
MLAANSYDGFAARMAYATLREVPHQQRLTSPRNGSRGHAPRYFPLCIPGRSVIWCTSRSPTGTREAESVATSAGSAGVEDMYTEPVEPRAAAWASLLPAARQATGLMLASSVGPRYNVRGVQSRLVGSHARTGSIMGVSPTCCSRECSSRRSQ